MPKNAVRAYLSRIGSKGGRGASLRKRAALAQNLIKANAARKRKRALGRKLYPVRSITEHAILGNGGGAVQ